jgi:hypothetical protein
MTGCITERETPHGTWWRYRHADGEPDETLIAAMIIADTVAADHARKDCKTYYAGRATTGNRTIYVFPCDHPDARNVAIHVVFEFTPDGERIQRPGPCAARRH